MAKPYMALFLLAVLLALTTGMKYVLTINRYKP